MGLDPTISNSILNLEIIIARASCKTKPSAISIFLGRNLTDPGGDIHVKGKGVRAGRIGKVPMTKISCVGYASHGLQRA